MGVTLHPLYTAHPNTRGGGWVAKGLARASMNTLIFLLYMVLLFSFIYFILFFYGNYEEAAQTLRRLLVDLMCKIAHMALVPLKTGLKFG